MAWIDLLLMANHKEKRFYIRNNEIIVKRGQLARAETTLAENWRWSRKKVRNFLNSLKSGQQVNIRKSHIISIITIVNYEQYQQKETTKGTTEGQQKNINKNVKNVKNKKKKTYSANFLIFCEKYPGKINKDYAYECWKRKKKQRPSIDGILESIENQIKEKEQLGKAKEFVPQWKMASTWINQMCWNDIVNLKKEKPKKENLFLKSLKEENSGK